MRRAPTRAEKLGAVLLEVQRLRNAPVNREWAKTLTADQICNLFVWINGSPAYFGEALAGAKRVKSADQEERIAACLVEYQRLRGDPICAEHVAIMSPSQVCSLFQWDHAANLVAYGASNHPTVLTPLLISEHRKKTAKIDAQRIAKARRISRTWAEHKQTVAEKEEKCRTKWSKRKIQNGNTRWPTRSFSAR